MSTAQHLLRRILDLAGGPAGAGYVLVLDGEGLADLPAELPTAHGPCSVARVGTEIGLRHLLFKARGAPLIVVLPLDLAERLPPDLLRRARNQRVHALSTVDVLEVVLGSRVTGADAPHLQALALVHLEALANRLGRRTVPTVVDRRLLTDLLLDVVVGSSVRDESPAKLLSRWVEAPPAWSGDERRLVLDALPRLHGDAGKLLAWALGGDDDSRYSLLIIHGALLSVEVDEIAQDVWGPFWRAASEDPTKMDRRMLRQQLVMLAADAIDALGAKAEPYLLQADRLARVKLTPKVMATSLLLPLGFENRAEDLARRASAGEAVSGDEIDSLRRHRAAGIRQAEIEVLEAMARLSRYLATEPEPSRDVVDQLRAYQRQGAFADLAALSLRRALAGSGEHHDAAKALLERYRERRDAQNEQFARTIARSYEVALHAEGLVPLHRLWKRVVAPLWKEKPRERIFLAVLDGCSYPVFLELLLALAEDPNRPMGLRPDEEGIVAGIPALAPLPTITSHARGAIFLGELPQDPLVAETVFRDQEEAKTDKARLQQNQALGDRSRALFLKGDLTDGGMSLVAALGQPSLDVVAAVFNAVDDQIGSSNTSALLRIEPKHIIGFLPSLAAALKAGRQVLIVADHGHSPFVDKKLRAGAGAMPRCLPLSENAEVPEGFLEIDVEGLGGTPGRRAFAYKTGVYLGSQQVGFHGGCSLEEMVVPLAWLHAGGLQASEPAWWYGRERVAAPVAAPPPLEPPILTPLPTPQVKIAQAELFTTRNLAASLPLPNVVRAQLTEDEITVLTLLKENGSARSSELAERLKKTPGRLNGLLRVLRRKLHSVGALCFEDETLPSGETLYRYRALDGGKTP